MARIAGVNIPPHKHTAIGLTAIYGIGRPRALKICEATGVAVDKKVKDLDDADLEKLNKFSDAIYEVDMKNLDSRTIAQVWPD